MELFDLLTPVEHKIAEKATAMRVPIGGSIELTPLCNMNCKMCYIRQNPEEMKKQGRMLSCDEWLRIAKEARDAGVLFLLLTGGEPLVYPEFERLYTELTDMGFVITINTNGTLINKEWADLFARRPCRRLNITVYGKDDESYERLCRNPKGHTQLMHALDLLDNRKVMYRLNHTITPDNRDCLEYACELAKTRKVPIQTASYLFPPIKRDNEDFERLTPSQAAFAKIERVRLMESDRLFHLAVNNALNKLNAIEIGERDDSLHCRAGKSGFWMSWNGDLLPCGMFLEPKMSLLEHSFGEAWKYIVEETAKLRMYSGCRTCDKRHVCNVCAAGCLTESGGDMTQKPEYICQMTEAYCKLLKQYAEKVEK